MPRTRRMEDNIRTLCQKLIESDDNSKQFRTLAVELRSALTQQIWQIRTRLVKYPLIQERRSTDD